MNYLCIDFGGTKTLVCIIRDDGTIATEVRFETPEHYPDFLDQLTQTIEELPEKFGRGVMSVPGLIDHENGSVIALGNRPWTDLALKQDIVQRTGVELTLMNDARLAGLAEAAYLKDRYRRVLYMTISTGIGIALSVDGKLVEALNDTEFGHIPVFIDGKYTEWEDIGSGRAIVETYGKRASDINDPETWETIAHTFTLGIGVACAAFQPDAIVFGGGVGQQSEKFAHFVEKELAEILHPVVKQPKALLSCHYKDESVIYGCFELGKQHAA